VEKEEGTNASESEAPKFLSLCHSEMLAIQAILRARKLNLIQNCDIDCENMLKLRLLSCL